MNEQSPIHVIVGADDSGVAKRDDTQASSLIGILWRGLLICAVIASIDYLTLSSVEPKNMLGWRVFIAMGVFTLQTIGLSVFIGRNVNKSLVWWLFFWWSLVLVNLNLMLIHFGIDWSTKYIAVADRFAVSDWLWSIFS